MTRPVVHGDEAGDGLESIAELERMLKAATPGPWERDCKHLESQDLIQDEILAEGGTVCDTLNATLREFSYDEDGWHDSVGSASMRLIAALRNAAPALIRAARELQELRSALEFLDGHNGAYIADKLAAGVSPIDVLEVARELGWKADEHG